MVAWRRVLPVLVTWVLALLVGYYLLVSPGSPNEGFFLVLFAFLLVFPGHFESIKTHLRGTSSAPIDNLLERLRGKVTCLGKLHSEVVNLSLKTTDDFYQENTIAREIDKATRKMRVHLDEALVLVQEIVIHLGAYDMELVR